MQVTSPGAAAAWDTPTIEPNLPPSVNAYDPGNPDNGGTLDSPPQQQDSSASYYDTAEPQPLPQGPAPGFEILYNKPLLVDPATGEALEEQHTKPLQISLDGSGPVDYGVNKPLQIDGAPHVDIGYNKPLLVDPATGEAMEVQHTKPLQIAPESAMQAASPDAAAAVAAPKASAMEIAALELLLAEPANQEMIAQFGPPLAPLNTGTDVGSGIQARFGADLGARLTQLQEAQNNVRGQFLKALDEAQQHPGPGVVGSEYIRKVESWRDGELTETSLYTVTYPASATQDSDLKAIDEQFKLGMHGRSSTAWELTDPAEFAKAYAAGDSPAQKAFASLHGKEPLQFNEAVQHGDSDIGPDITPAYYSLGESKLVIGSQTVDDNGNQGGWSESTLQKTQLTPEHNRRLINNEYLWFDPVNGWSTDLENNIRPSSSFLDKAIPLVFAGGLTMMTAGAFGITAASASTSLGQSMALGAISSASMQLATGGKLDLGNILRSALTAGVTFGVMDVSGVSGALQSTELATRTLGHLGKAGLQGLLQEATGGKFKDGLTNSLISSVAGEVGKSLDSHIAKLSEEGSLNVQEASTLRLMSRAASSAVRVAGSGDAAAGFASDFLGGLMEEANPFAGKAEAGGKTDKAGKPNKGENTSDTTPGEKPNNGWVQSLGASDVDPNQAQGLKPGGSLQGLRVSGDALSNWSDDIDGGISLTGSMAPEARTTGEAVVGKGQGPLAALAAAGLSAQEQQAAYGQLLASGQVRLNAQGVPMVQPGQVLRFDLSDTSAAQLGGRAIAAESGGRAQRVALAAQQAANARQGMSPEQAAQIYTQYGGRSASYAGLEPTWSGRMVDVAGGGVDALGNPTGMPEQVWVSDKPPTRYAEGLGNAVRTVGHLVDGAVQLAVNGTITSMVVRPASGLAALPALALGGTEAYSAIQQDLQQQWSPESNNPGAVAIRQSMGQILAPVGQTLQQMRDASERRFGDGWTTAGVTAAQAALEVTGFLGGVAAIPAGRVALGNLGSDIRVGFNALGDAMPVGSGDAARGSLASQVGAVGDFEGVRIGGGVKGGARIEALAANDVRFSQNTVSYNKVDRRSGKRYTYDDLVQSMKTDGWKGDPVDVVKMPDGAYTSMDNTRISAARDAGIDVQANVRGFNDPLPADMIATRRFGDAKTWGEALTGRISNQKPPSFGNANPNGSPTPPKVTGKP